MKEIIESIRGSRPRPGLIVLTFLLGTTAALAQGTPSVAGTPAATTSPVAADTLSGKYEGTAKIAGAPDEPLSLELKNDSGRISGHMLNGQTPVEVSEGSYADGKLSLSFGQAAKEGLLTATVEGEKIIGDLLIGPQKRTIELKRVMSAAATSVTAATATPATPINLTGDWDGIADAQGQPFPFLLTLKVEGEGVSGSSSSQLGASTVKSGSWKDGRLVFQLEGQNGVISMSAIVIEGKLSGEFDFAGQLQGKWVAIKKN